MMDSLVAIPIDHASWQQISKVADYRERTRDARDTILSTQVAFPVLTQGDEFDHYHEPWSVEDDDDRIYDGTLLAAVNVREPDPSCTVIYAAWTPALLKAVDAAAKHIYKQLNVDRRKESAAWQASMRSYCQILLSAIKTELAAALKMASAPALNRTQPVAGVSIDVIVAWKHAIARLQRLIDDSSVNSPIDTSWISPIMTPIWFDAENQHWLSVAPAIREMVSWVEPSWAFAEPLPHRLQPSHDFPRYGDGMIVLCSLSPWLAEGGETMSRVCTFDHVSADSESDRWLNRNISVVVLPYAPVSPTTSPPTSKHRHYQAYYRKSGGTGLSTAICRR